MKEDEGKTDPNNNSRTVRRIVIPPRYITTFVPEFDERTGEKLTRTSRNNAKDQGRCGQCERYERADNRLPVYNNQYMRHPEIVLKDSALKDKDFAP